MTEEEATDAIQYQSGKSSVEHKNLGVADSEHPLGEEAKDFTADMQTLIRKVADDLYQSWEATIREFIANAETATLRVDEYARTGETMMLGEDAELIVEDGYEPKIEITWRRDEGRLIIRDNGIGLSSYTADRVFRHIGSTTGRDEGKYSGQFGMGVLSFVKLIGIDNSMVMTTHSRLSDENYASYISLAGLEPIPGELPDDQYGTRFELTPDGDYDIRRAVEKYAEWTRVPVLYYEYDENGQQTFDEDYGAKKFEDGYDKNKLCLTMEEPGAFRAACAPDSSGKTLLLSMPIERNNSGSTNHEAPFKFDVRLLDESGKVVRSTNGHEGLMPTTRGDYEDMLLEARDGYITDELLSRQDIVGQKVEAGEHDGMIAIGNDDYDKRFPNGSDRYIPERDLSDDDEPGPRLVINGPHEGREIISEDEWTEMDEGRAAFYVPEDVLETPKLNEDGTIEGDLTLPEPTSDRDRLQQESVFWNWIGKQFETEFYKEVKRVYEMIDKSDNPLETIMELDPQNLTISPKN